MVLTEIGAKLFVFLVAVAAIWGLIWILTGRDDAE